MPDVHPPMPPRGPGTNQFLPLGGENSRSPGRGQALPSLISSRSSASIMKAKKRKSMSRSYQDDDLENGESDGEDELLPPKDFPIKRGGPKKEDRKASLIMTPQMRSQRLIGNSNPRYRWEQYYKTEKQMEIMTKALRRYYERNNYLIQQYLYIDRLLDSSLPSSLLQEYDVEIPSTIPEEDNSHPGSPPTATPPNGASSNPTTVRIKRTKAIYKLSTEETPLLTHDGRDETGPPSEMPLFTPEEDDESGNRTVTTAIYLNFAANTVLLILKVIVVVLSDSLSVLASLVDAALDFLSTFIVWVTSLLIEAGARDTINFPVGRKRLEPLGVLVFSVIMITSFFQVAIEAIQQLSKEGPHEIVQLTPAAIAIMATTVVVKAACWLWCRLIRNSSVQALAQDAMTDVIFNIFSIIFPLVGYYAGVWFLDPLGGLLLSAYVILTWSSTTFTHVMNLTGRAASADERNILLYLTMRFAKTIQYVQGLQAYSSGDRLNVEVDIVLDETTSLKDSHDISESLQYVLESVPGVERAWVHTDYKRINLPSHMEQM